jgi:histidine triad (HIT) family protein
MTITKEEADQIKEHLLKQLENFPEEKQSQIAEQINSMTEEQIENFIKQNKLTHLGNQCVFCAIAEEKMPSTKLEEDKNNLAILELNPETKGHALVLPKEHLDEIPESTRFMAQEIAKKIQQNLNPNEIEINELKIMGHSLLEVVPLYGEEKQKRQASEEELEALKEEILKKPEPKIEKKATPKKEDEEEIPILPPRIP